MIRRDWWLPALFARRRTCACVYACVRAMEAAAGSARKLGSGAAARTRQPGSGRQGSASSAGHAAAGTDCASCASSSARSGKCCGFRRMKRGTVSAKLGARESRKQMEHEVTSGDMRWGGGTAKVDCTLGFLAREKTRSVLVNGGVDCVLAQKLKVARGERERLLLRQRLRLLRRGGGLRQHGEGATRRGRGKVRVHADGSTGGKKRKLGVLEQGLAGCARFRELFNRNKCGATDVASSGT